MNMMQDACFGVVMDGYRNMLYMILQLIMMDIKRGGKQVKDSMFNYGKDTCVSNSMAHTGVLSIRHKNYTFNI